MIFVVKIFLCDKTPHEIFQGEVPFILKYFNFISVINILHGILFTTTNNLSITHLRPLLVIIKIIREKFREGL